MKIIFAASLLLLENVRVVFAARPSTPIQQRPRLDERDRGRGSDIGFAGLFP